MRLHHEAVILRPAQNLVEHCHGQDSSRQALHRDNLPHEPWPPPHVANSSYDKLSSSSARQDASHWI